MQQPGKRLRSHVVAGKLRARTFLAEAGYGAHDHARIHFLEGFVAESVLAQDAGRVVFDYDVEMAHQFDDDRGALGALEIDAQTALAPIVVDVGGRLPFDRRRNAALARIFTRRRHLQLDHVGAEVGKNPAEGGSRDILRDVQHAQAGKILLDRLSHLTSIAPGKAAEPGYY